MADIRLRVNARPEPEFPAGCSPDYPRRVGRVAGSSRRQYEAARVGLSRGCVTNLRTVLTAHTKIFRSSENIFYCLSSPDLRDRAGAGGTRFCARNVNLACKGRGLARNEDTDHNIWPASRHDDRRSARPSPHPSCADVRGVLGSSHATAAGYVEIGSELIPH